MLHFHPKAQTDPVLFKQIMEMGIPSDLSEIDLQRWKLIPQGGNFEDLSLKLRTKAKFSNAFRKLDLYKPSYTLPKNDGFSTGTFFHPIEPRRITLREKSRIASFPDHFQWVGNKNDITARIGNSVPPRFMQAIAEHVYQTFLQPMKVQEHDIFPP